MCKSGNQPETVTGFAKGQRFDGVFNGKISSIRSAGNKVLIICEDEKTILNGAFKPDAAAYVAGAPTRLVSSRHEAKTKKASSVNLNKTEGNENARGNVGFCDGHAEFMSRKEAISSRYSGNPTPDPAGL
jgi:prepilin-type processing-associated H-X9-DG protein